MPSDHPPSPQSPSQLTFDSTDLPHKPATSPRISNSLPTPAHSINGSMSSTTSDLTADASHVEELSNKRKRDLEDQGEREQKKVHVEDSRISIKDLHLDVGQKYLLCRTPHPVGAVPFSADLFERYGLSDVAQTVARINPDGKKNVIRKTYKNYISKVFQLPGAFEADKKDTEAPDSLWAMMTQPEEVWENQYRQPTKEIGLGLSEQTVASLGKAVTMARLKSMGDAWDEGILGSHSNKARDEAAKLAQNGARTPVHLSQAQNPAIQRSSKAEPPRPKRNIKKRSYGDASFDGYGEGFVDDDLHDGGYSTAEGDDRTGRKRPKKSGTMSAQAPLPRHNSYGPGSIGA